MTRRRPQPPPTEFVNGNKRSQYLAVRFRVPLELQRSLRWGKHNGAKPSVTPRARHLRLLTGSTGLREFWIHSVRNARIGSRAAALRAGRRVATRPARLNTRVVSSKMSGA
jgi:hypothetical protein